MRIHRQLRGILAALWLAVMLAESFANPGSAEGSVYFERHIRPIFVHHCYQCHSEEEGEQKGGLLLDRASGWLDGGDSGKAVIPGDLDGSLLISAVRREDEDSAMPPKKALPANLVKTLEQWVQRGAPGPADDMGETDFSLLGDQEHLFGVAEEHWAFKALEKQEPPKSADPFWNRTRTDRFVRKKHLENGVEPAPLARPRTLVRRLHYDLVGLPPTPEEVDAFVEDPRAMPVRVRAVVDDLLERPAFGEHWARMWLDVARYADTDNVYRFDTQTPYYYPYAFAFRNYVIAAFNEDKPVDQFIREQLAADHLDLPENHRDHAALGFLAVGPHHRGNAKNDYIDDMIDVTTRGFMGVTVSCARCHDHKFEPIPTADYYSLYGVFASVERPNPWEFDKFPRVKGFDGSKQQQADYEEERAALKPPKERKGSNLPQGEVKFAQVDLSQLHISHDGAPVRAMVVKEAKKPMIEPVVFERGDAGMKGEKLKRHFLSVLDPSKKEFNRKNSGRLDLARHITREDNPLTARVFVNRVWGELLGSHLVGTPSDFGLQGERPTHPELLDDLAWQFMHEQDWSLKKLVRSIVDSRTYQLRSDVSAEDALGVAESIAPDVENRWLWRGHRQPLSIEQLRDSVLKVAGTLEEQLYGRSVDLWADEYSHRRGVYGFVNRFNLDPTLRAFNFPSPNQTQATRPDSMVPQQALFLMNSPIVVDQARSLVNSAEFSSATSNEERISWLFRQVYQRPPHPVETKRIGVFLEKQVKNEADAWPLVAQSLLMSNEFIYLD
ncbi:MAG: PSD1 and planctomycete cytochrome C domain-containing protein [Verrucomicrobiota bacterium]